MAAVLRSSVVQAVRRASSGEGTLAVRALHTGRNNPRAYASRAKQNLKPAERVRREAGALGSLDVALRDMRYITRGAFGRYFVLFTVVTIMSEGVRELKIRSGQASLALSSMRASIDEFEVQEGFEFAEDFGSLFE